ncbi:hypothetical protein FA743_06990 [Paracoccus gahaiensis]|uniref:Flagellar basal body-associated FliL family protein n=1 Tax=Paracoccus gahaiensis TaxID=1706839 RepID=A0A4U0RBS6_9RHOB|nr:hypothetical protein [Paracoccus gahaiensis]TJZ92605.1 hypothetical protein FA743_06990 [Paracoccus gahaiensis]
MIRKLIPLALPVLALVGGAFGGDMLRGPAPAEEGAHDAAEGEDTTAGPDATEEHASAEDQGESGGHDAGDQSAGGDAGWFTFPTQFFVPLVRQGDMRDIMILTLTLQTDAASAPALATKEHALRDALLRALMIHANTGGFDGNYTADRNLALLRESLLKAGQTVTDLPLTAVLIEDIARQPG